MSPRFELTGYDRIDIDMAREALADSKAMELTDIGAMARMLGRLEAVLDSLLKMVEGEQ